MNFGCSPCQGWRDKKLTSIKKLEFVLAFLIILFCGSYSGSQSVLAEEHGTGKLEASFEGFAELLQQSLAFSHVKTVVVSGCIVTIKTVSSNAAGCTDPSENIGNIATFDMLDIGEIVETNSGSKSVLTMRFNDRAERYMASAEEHLKAPSPERKDEIKGEGFSGYATVQSLIAHQALEMGSVRTRKEFRQCNDTKTISIPPGLSLRILLEGEERARAVSVLRKLHNSCVRH